MTGGLWDKRLARWLVRPLVGTPIGPNHVTAAALVTGIAAAALFAQGPGRTSHLGAALYVLALFLDHADGELARASGKSSRFGHVFDRLTSLCTHTALFIGVGIGLREHPIIGAYAPILGVVAGLAISAIFATREAIGRRHGQGAVALPQGGGFEVEDVMYAVAPIAWLGGLGPFLVLAAVGAPLFLLWTLLRRR